MSNISQFLANPARQLRYVLTGVGAASSTATWTAPSSIAVNEVLVVCVGGGGAGGAGGPVSSNNPTASGGGGGGGGSGAVVGYIYSVGSGTTISLTAAGNGGTSSANNVGPAPVPISATGGAAGSNGSAGSSGGGSGGSGGVATRPIPSLSSDGFSIAGIPGSSGVPGGNATQSFAGTYGGAAAGGGGYGGSLQNVLPFFQIMQSSGTSLGGNSASGPSMAATKLAVPAGDFNYVTGGGGARNSATNGSIGYGGGGGVGGDISTAGTQSSGPSPGASASVGAVFVLY